jgi:chloramphenicol 3-O phosphotransferase
VILNGAPRSGKSSIAAAIQERLDGTWMNLGVDVARAATPPELQPGIGLRPGEPQHPAAAALPRLYAALFESVAAHARLGLDVVVDLGLYDAAIRADALGRLDGLPVLLVGVRCPVETIVERRRASEPGTYATAGAGEPVPEPVLRWQAAVHQGWEYDLEVDSSVLSPEACAGRIGQALVDRRAPGLRLRGERVVLRPVEPADEPRLREIRSEPAVALWWPEPEPDWPFEDDDGVRLAIVVEGEVAGLVQFSEDDDADFRSASIDVFLATAQHGRGLGSEAVRLVVRHLIEERGHHRITIDPAAANAQAIRAYEKAGFQRVGILRAYQRNHRGNGWMDGLLMELVEG